VIVLGVDPGNEGAFALYDHRRRELIGVWDMPTYKVTVGKPRVISRTKPALAKAVNAEHATMKAKSRNKIDPVGVLEIVRFCKDQGATLAVIEDVGARPGQSGMFVFGLGCGLIQMACVAEELNYELVRPQAWKKAMKSDADKTAQVPRANLIFSGQRHFFTTKRGTDRPDRAEAALMARYGAEFLSERGAA